MTVPNIAAINNNNLPLSLHKLRFLPLRPFQAGQNDVSKSAIAISRSGRPWALEVHVRICMTSRPLANSRMDGPCSNQLEFTPERTHNSRQPSVSPRGNKFWMKKEKEKEAGDSRIIKTPSSCSIRATAGYLKETFKVFIQLSCHQVVWWKWMLNYLFQRLTVLLIKLAVDTFLLLYFKALMAQW